MFVTLKTSGIITIKITTSILTTIFHVNLG